MSLITTNNLGKSFGARDLFSDISLSIPKRARIGLVGPNGVGKTTLLRILLKMEEASSGYVQHARGLSAGYLPQEADFDSERTLWDECRAVFSGLIARQQELEQLEASMSTDHSEQLLQTYGKKQQDFEHLGGYTFETRIRQILDGLGFDACDYSRPLGKLSGGQRTRALLARLLLLCPDLLLLDEPTNSLDIQAIEWLEDFLRDWDGAVLCVSHDRYFLDRVVNTIWEMTPAMEIYHGNYSAYLPQRAERYQHRLEEYQAQQEFIEKEEDYIRRNIAGQNTRQAQGRRKRLERMLEEARLAPPVEARRLRLTMQAQQRSGDLVLRTYQLQIGYADEGHPLFCVPNLVLERGECAAIIGPNGAGKTTFLKTLLGEIPPYAGEVDLGASLKVGYFAQAHESLNPEKTLAEEIAAAAPRMLPAEVRDYLARFLFTGDDAFKQVSMLSGGERGRLALAILALNNSNLLLLDEPTNHLDLPSQEALQNVLSDYQGTILLVSHDRYLVDALATQVWEVVPSDISLNVFKGSYTEYREFKAISRQAMNMPTDGQPANQAPRPVSLQGIAAGESKSRPSKNEERKRLMRQQSLEKEIADLEQQMQIISSQLEHPPADLAAVQRLGQEYNRLQTLLDKCMEAWAECVA